MSRLRWSFVAIAVLAVTAGTVFVVNGAGADPVVSTPEPVTKEVTIERGDITVSESLDGTVEEIDTITVVHRIDGQTVADSSTPSKGSTATATDVPTVVPAGLVSLDATAATIDAGVASPDADIVTVALLTTVSPSVETATATTVPPYSEPSGSVPSGSVPSGSVPSGSVPAGSVPTDSTPTDSVPAESVPTDSIPTDSVPTDSIPTDSVPADATTPDDADQVPAAPAAPSRGAGGALPSSPTTGTGSGAAATAEPVTEMITGIAEVGTPIASGDVLYTVESRPVVALAGVLPAWRTMESSSSDGADIAQLEAALVALGYDPDASVTVDTEWDSATTTMVERWQIGLGVDDTGEVTLGSVVFIAHPAIVASTSVSVGDEVSNGETVLTLTGTVQRVIVEVPTELQANVVPSMIVDVAGTPGTVTRLRSADGTDGVTVQAVISPDTTLDVEAGSSVKVTITHELASNQLIVPTDAVVSQLDGTYAVQVVDTTGGHEFITVEIIAVSGNRTAATGAGLSESSVVLAPA